MGENNRITAKQVEAVVESIDRKLSEKPADKVLRKKNSKKISSRENRNMKKHYLPLMGATVIPKQITMLLLCV